MDRHTLATAVYHLIGSLHEIKKISNSDRIDTLCINGISCLMNLTDAAEAQKELDEIRSRMIDPTN